MIGTNLSVLSSAFDALIAVLVQVGKVLPKLLVGSWDDIPVLNGRKSVRQVANGSNMEFVLMRLGRC